MADVKKFDAFVIEETEEGYVITLSAQGGASLAVALTPEDMGDVLEALNDVLADEDEDEDDDEDV